MKGEHVMSVHTHRDTQNVKRCLHVCSFVFIAIVYVRCTSWYVLCDTRWFLAQRNDHRAPVRSSRTLSPCSATISALAHTTHDGLHVTVVDRVVRVLAG